MKVKVKKSNEIINVKKLGESNPSDFYKRYQYINPNNGDLYNESELDFDCNACGTFKKARIKKSNKIIDIKEFSMPVTYMNIINGKLYDESELEFIEDKTEELDKKYLRMAKIWSENSYAIRKKVGCLIVKDNMIISDGYNGTPSGFPNVCEYVKDTDGVVYEGFNNVDELKEFIGWMGDKGWGEEYELITKPEVLHAEANALTKIAKSNNSSKGATLYVTYEPCLDCSKMIIQAGIKRVVYDESYRSHAGIKLLHKAGVEVVQCPIS